MLSDPQSRERYCCLLSSSVSQLRPSNLIAELMSFLTIIISSSSVPAFQLHRKEHQTPAREDKKDRHNNIVIPYVAGVSEKLRRVFSKYDIPVYFRPSNTLRQKLVHPKDKTPKHKLNNVVYAVQCSEECPDFYIGETKQPLHKHMAQHRRATSTGQDSAVHLHLKDKGQSLRMPMFTFWTDGGVKEAIYVHCERPSLNRGGGL
ncbi:uncharacterized protein LOC112431314 isoform X3 [Maylandia zebra]|uniref:uncharacterized protein LOC112431314 isoform X3 n=1 Tax=Maylandia zebra TaxID=106582 RepID=UPI00403CB702